MLGWLAVHAVVDWLSGSCLLSDMAHMEKYKFLDNQDDLVQIQPAERVGTFSNNLYSNRVRVLFSRKY